MNVLAYDELRESGEFGKSGDFGGGKGLGFGSNVVPAVDNLVSGQQPRSSSAETRPARSWISRGSRNFQRSFFVNSMLNPAGFPALGSISSATVAAFSVFYSFLNF